MMTLEQRAEILPLLYRLQAELAVLNMRCCDAKALQVGASVVAMKTICDETLADFQPDKPRPLTFPDGRY